MAREGALVNCYEHSVHVSSEQFLVGSNIMRRLDPHTQEFDGVISIINGMVSPPITSCVFNSFSADPCKARL